MLFQYYPQVHHNYRYELNKDLHFAAAHFVPSILAGKCQNLHGHTYTVNITVVGNTLDDSGFLVNFSALKHLVEDRWDHSLLNDHADFDNDDPNLFPTSEIIARTIWENVETYLAEHSHDATCVQVILRETPESYIIYRPGR